MEIGSDDLPRQNPVMFLWFYHLAISHVKEAALLGRLRTQPECHVQEGNNLFSVSAAEKQQVCAAAKKAELRDEENWTAGRGRMKKSQNSIPLRSFRKVAKKCHKQQKYSCRVTQHIWAQGTNRGAPRESFHSQSYEKQTMVPLIVASCAYLLKCSAVGTD